MTRKDKTPIPSQRAVDWRHRRFLVACLLAGPGSGEKLAMEMNVSLSSILRASRCAKKAGKDSHYRSWRIETYIGKWTEEQFSKFGHMLNGPSPIALPPPPKRPAAGEKE